MAADRPEAPVIYPCTRCDGKGRIPGYGHVLGGVCFKCGGTGRQKRKPATPTRRWTVLATRTTDHHPDVVVCFIRATGTREGLRAIESRA